MNSVSAILQTDVSDDAGPQDSPMKFFLSNTQIKALRATAQPILIALPTPPDDPDDWIEWARGAIVDHGELVIDAEPCVLRCTPTQTDGNLSAVLGAIVDPTGERQRFTFGVDAVVCTLSPERPRHELDRTLVQWPKCAVRGEHRWPR